jgi:hypothetical protein
MQQGSELTETTMEQLAQIIIENDSKKASDMNL